MHNFNFSRCCQTAFLSSFKNLNSNQQSNTVLFVLALYFLSFFIKVIFMVPQCGFSFYFPEDFRVYLFRYPLFRSACSKIWPIYFFVLFTLIFICSFTLSLLISWNYLLILKMSLLLSICVKNKFLPLTLLKKI